MTRTRKKCFVATLEQAILDLERELALLRSRAKSSCSDQTTTGTSVAARSMVTPELSSVPSPPLDVVPSSSLVSDETLDVSKRTGDNLHDHDDGASPTKRVCRHGFSLDNC
jgi:hypothetical protein